MMIMEVNPKTGYFKTLHSSVLKALPNEDMSKSDTVISQLIVSFFVCSSVIILRS